MMKLIGNLKILALSKREITLGSKNIQEQKKILKEKIMILEQISNESNNYLSEMKTNKFSKMNTFDLLLEKNIEGLNNEKKKNDLENI